MYLIKMRIAARYTLSQDLSYTDVAHRYIPTIQRPWRILMTHQTYNPTAILPARIVIIVKISTIISPRLLKWTSEKSRYGCVNIIWFRNGWPTFRAWKFQIPRLAGKEMTMDIVRIDSVVRCKRTFNRG